LKIGEVGYEKRARYIEEVKRYVKSEDRNTKEFAEIMLTLISSDIDNVVTTNRQLNNI